MDTTISKEWRNPFESMRIQKVTEISTTAEKTQHTKEFKKWFQLAPQWPFSVLNFPLGYFISTAKGLQWIIRIK